MPGLSIHVVDVSRGVVATGMAVEIHRLFEPIGQLAAERLCAGRIAQSGLLEDASLAEVLAPGVYEARFDVAAYYREVGTSLPAIPFLEVALYRFGIDDPAQHYHLPMKLTPWGLSCFRGGS